MQVRSDRRVAGVLRTASALIVLLAFWGAVAYSFWPEILPALLRAVGFARGIGAQEVESRTFEVRNSSTADPAQLRHALDVLEADYVAIHQFLGRQPEVRVPVLIANGSGPAWSDGVRLNLFYDQGRFDLSTAPFFLVLLSEGDLSVPGMVLFVEGAFAVYVTEEIGRAHDLMGQPTDAWVTRFAQQGTLMPLAEAWAVGLPQGEELPALLRALLEGGSFMRWLADACGPGTLQELRSGLSLVDATGLSVAEAEEAWLASVASRALQPQSCAQAVPGDSPLYGFCEQLDSSASNGK